MNLYTKEREGKAPCPLPEPAPVSAKARPPAPDGGRQARWGLARLVVADEASRGRRGQWGWQATGLMPESSSIED
jgi:hypothetical protein